MNQLMEPVFMADKTHRLLSLQQVEQPVPTVCSLHIKPFNFPKKQNPEGLGFNSSSLICWLFDLGKSYHLSDLSSHTCKGVL